MKRKPSTLLVCLLLGALSLAAYWRVTTHGFVIFDDPKYICQNAHVKAGLTWAGIVWAFTSGYASNWHPVTWISHMLDCQFFGLNAGGHHLTSIFIHALNAALLFLLLKRMTGAFWRSAVVAALFAWHPLHVESVAWAAERKDVFSALFWILTMLAYVRYAEATQAATGANGDPPGESKSRRMNSSGERQASVAHGSAGATRRAARYYALALVLFALGLMCKPMLVTLPCVLVLIDFWPLRRLSFPSLQYSTTPPLRLLLEKLPFFVLALAASVVTFFVQKAGGAVSSLMSVPLGARVANALVAYGRYLFKTVWPADLAVFYPLPDHWPLVAVAGSGLLLLGLSVWIVRCHRRFPYLLVGWFWFLGALVPTIGLVQVGSQSIADRYTYLPSIGLFIILAWGSWELAGAYSRLKRLLPVMATAALVACLSWTVSQVRCWHDEETLFRHAMEVTTDNYLAYDHLAKVYESAGRNEEALAAYSALLRLKPRYLEGRYNLGTLLMNLGRLEEAAQHLRMAVEEKPHFAQAQSNLGITLFRQNRSDEALTHLEEAVRLNPQDPDAYVNLGITLLASGRAKEAADSFVAALRLTPEVPETHFLLAYALSRGNQPGEAVRQAEKARDLALATGRREVAMKATDLMRVCQAEKVSAETAPVRDGQ